MAKKVCDGRLYLISDVAGPVAGGQQNCQAATDQAGKERRRGKSPQNTFK